MTTISCELWRKACIVWKKHYDLHRRGIGRKKLAEVLGIPEQLAREIIFALRNREVLSLRVNEYDIQTKEIELVLADLHIPYHDQTAIDTVFSYLEEEKIVPTIVTVLGDLVDFYKISKFCKNPTKKSVKEEIDLARSFLTDLRNRFPNARIIYYEGNHETRLNKYIIENASEIYELITGLLENKMGLKELNIEYMTVPFRLGKLWHLHGHERVGGNYNPEYITNVIWKYVYDNFIVGHFHRNQDKTFKNIAGELYWGGAVGHLATTFEYALLNNWTQGFCIVEYDDRGRFKASIKNVNKGEVF